MKGKDSKISKEFILESISNDALTSQIAIFEKYLGISGIYKIIKEKEMIVNPLRKDDFPTCTFKVYYNNDIPKLWFRDWAESKGMDCIDLVKRLANCDYNSALELIAYHFSLLSAERQATLKYVMNPKQILELNKSTSKMTQLRIKSIGWSKEHINYWKQYELDEEDVVYDTVPIKAYWYNGIKFNINKIAFAYTFGNYNYKIYIPFADRKKKELKFIHNRADIIQGENQLKYDKRTLIITSSNKDVKVLRKQARVNNFDYEVVAPMSETTPISKEKMDFYKSKYEYILLYYNNDERGIINSTEHSKRYDIPYIVNPKGTPKDPSDFVKELGSERLTMFLREQLFKNIPPF
jgi:hypothetical protein